MPRAILSDCLPVLWNNKLVNEFYRSAEPEPAKCDLFFPRAPEIATLMVSIHPQGSNSLEGFYKSNKIRLVCIPRSNFGIH